jgi:3D-(3,5/4)-trihydroxycyclohexane-1,2-dione acylhydrolase (decyclizing)
MFATGVAGRARRTCSPPRRSRMPTGCRCCSSAATASSPGCPSRSCSRWKTSTIRPFGVTDAFKPVTGTGSGIHPCGWSCQALPAAVATMLDPADCGPALLGLPQDVQGWAYDYPEAFLRQDRSPDPPPGRRRGRDRRGRRASGGCRAADDHRRRRGAVFRRRGRAHRLRRGAPDPVVETIAGRANLRATIRSTSARSASPGRTAPTAIAEKADVILAVGTRLQDFTTGSWTAFDKAARIVGLNVGPAGRGQAPSLSGGGRREAWRSPLECRPGDHKAPAAGWKPRQAISARPGTPTSPRTWPTATTGPIPTPRPSAW